MPDLDLDAAYRAYLAEALGAPDRRSFSLASQAFMAQLGNGHSSFDDRELGRVAGPALGFHADFVEGRWVVAWSGRPDVKVGDVVSALDGIETEAWFQRQRRYLAASSERAQRSSFFFKRYLLPEVFAVQLGDGRQVQVGPAAPLPTFMDRKVEGRWLEEKRVAYLTIPDFDSGYLTGVTSLAGDLQVLSPARVERPAKQLFRGRLIVLIGRQVGSAAEDFCIPFKDNHRATFVGEATGGSTGQPFRFDFENGLSFRVGARRTSFPDGSPFEGVGVAPDVVVPITMASLRAGRDEALEVALKLAGK